MNIDPSKFSFSPFEYIKKLRQKQLNTLDPSQLIDDKPSDMGTVQTYNPMRRQSVVAEFSIYNDLKNLLSILPKSEHHAIIAKYSSEQGTKDLKHDFQTFFQDVRSRAVEHRSKDASPSTQ